MSTVMKSSGFRVQLETLFERFVFVALLLLCVGTAFVAVGCGEHQESPPKLQPVEALRRGFPDQVSRVLHGSETLVAVGDGFAPALSADLAAATGRRGGLSAALPKRAEEAIRFHRLGGFEFRVREVGASGEGSLVEGAVAYSRPGGTSFWTATEVGYEEWLLLDAGIATSREPVATWEIEGAQARQVADTIEIVGKDGASYSRVTAPAAFAAGGRPVDARLSVHGARIELWVDAGGEAVLVDPVWTSTGAMSTARREHAAVRLVSGKVLVMGGQNSTTELGGAQLASAELYDPSSDTWASAGTMSVGRKFPTATLLSDGRVLVVGGANLGVALASTDLYDPLTNSWTSGPPVSLARWGNSAILLPSGKVLVVGGGAMVSSTSAELFDPSTNTWASAGSTVANLQHPGLALLPNGKVLRAGGSGYADAELYDPVTNTWSLAAPMTAARTDNTTTLLPTGKVLVAGGRGTGTFTTAELYDPSLNTWTQTPPMGAGRSYGHVATVLSDGKVLLVGGFAGASLNLLTSTELYDSATNTWSSAGSLVTKRWYPTATLLLSGKVLVAGGWNGEAGNPYLSSAELFDPAANVWTSTAAMSTGRSAHTATLLQSGKVLVVGGYNFPASSSPSYLGTAEIYDPFTNFWASAASIPGGRAFHTATLLQSGKVLVAGGQNGITSLGTAYVYDPVGNTWAAAQMPSRRSQHSATLLSSGKVLVAGGYDSAARASSALYDPITSTWSSGGSMSSARYSHTATLLSSGSVLVTGGLASLNVTLASAEIYDPVTDVFTSATPMTGARAFHTTTLLPKGKVLVAGGFGSSGVIATAETYNPTTGSWAPAASMSSSRYNQTATLLQNGYVLMAGGYSGTNYLSSVEIYNDTTNSWLTIPSMITTRSYHAATLLGSGKVLLTGGKNNDSNGLVNSELYAAVMIDDGKPCTIDAWNVSLGQVTHTNLANGTACSDGNVCTQSDTCQAGACTGGSAVAINDNNPCTIDSCDPVAGVTHIPSPIGSSCTNSSLCDGVETCDGSGSCVAGTAVDTDDGDLCTTDSCDPILGVLHAPIDINDQLPATIDRCDPATGIISHTICAAPDLTVATRLYEAAACIYSGAQPLQTGLTPGILDPVKISVLQGVVTTKAGIELSGVKVSVLYHGPSDPQSYGSTYTRSNGAFELAVNGGESLTLQYVKQGYLPAQRQVNAAWQHYAAAPDVVLIELDAQVTDVEPGLGTAQVARGTVQSDLDENGVPQPRQATVVFPSGLGGTMTVPGPNGTTTTLALPEHMHVRATEYTVGSRGPNAMPGALPPTSAYTYAVELSVDEAIDAGATSVNFSSPVPFYVDNFLDLPVGVLVPVGYYDSQQSAWVASNNGRVIKIKPPVGNAASIDTDGDDVADSPAALLAFGITPEEQIALASLYAPGKTLWRAALSHFTPWDLNFPYGAGANSCEPSSATCGAPDPSATHQKENPCTEPGSIIECENQILGERIPVAGTPFSLHYQSDRAAGRLDLNHVDIPLTGNSPSSALVSIELFVNIGGKITHHSFPCSAPDQPCKPNNVHGFDWDGLDIFGNKLVGKQLISVDLGYTYKAVYMTPSEADKSFGLAGSGGGGGGVLITGVKARQELTKWKHWEDSIGAWINTVDGLGGWSLSPHHAYDPNGRILYQGDGSRSSTKNFPTVIRKIAGNPVVNPVTQGDGIPAVEAWLGRPEAVEAGPDGSIYICDSSTASIRKITPDGIIHTVAGIKSSPGFSGDGGLAILARLNNPQDVALGPDGSLYIADTNNNVVRKVSPAGIITTVAGQFSVFPPGADGIDGVQATATTVQYPHSLAVSSDGNLYIAASRRVRRVGVDGVIHTVAGSVSGGNSVNDVPAVDVGFYPTAIALSSTDTLYIASDDNMIRRVDQNGIIRHVAGTGQPGYDPSQDGFSAKAALIANVSDLAVGTDGTVFIVARGPAGRRVVRRISPDGIISTIAGRPVADILCPATDYCGFGGPATSVSMVSVSGIAISASGTLYLADPAFNSLVLEVKPSFPGVTLGNMAVTSASGREIYVFDTFGKHISTKDTLLGGLIYQFGYSSAGVLTTITDIDNQVTQIQRGLNGNPTAIVAPFNQVTALATNAEKYLSSVTNPANEQTSFTYKPGTALLATLLAPLNMPHVFTYDSMGRLERDTDPAGGYKELVRTDLTPKSYEVVLSTAMGRTRRHKIESLPAGASKETHTRSDEIATIVDRDWTTNWKATSPDGTHAVELGGDPRFGTQALLPAKETTTTPGGKTLQILRSRAATLSDPFDSLSLVSLTDTTKINEKSFTSVFNKASKTIVSTSPMGRSVTATLDAKGRVTQTQIPGLLPRGYGYDAHGRLSTITQGTRVWTMGYNSTSGYLATVTDPLLQTSSFLRDQVGRVTMVSRPDSYSTVIGYDANGNVSSVLPPSLSPHVHGFTHTPADLLGTYSAPVVGTQPVTTTWSSDLDQMLMQVTRSSEGPTVFIHDSTSGRLDRIDLPSSMGSLINGYDQTTGALSSISGPSVGVSVGYSYDGPLLTGRTWTWTNPNSTTGTAGVQRVYDDNFRVTSEQLTSGYSVAYTYDDDGLLATAGGLTLTRAASVGSPSVPLNALVVGTALGSVSDTIGYDGYEGVSDYTAQAGATTLYDVTYGRDELGRIEDLVESLEGQPSSSYHYTYDLAGRLVDVTLDGAPSVSYVYDPNGNRTDRITPGETTSATYDAQDRLVSYGSTSYAYTASGELLTKTVGGTLAATYAYDSLGSLRSVVLPTKTVSYTVDGEGHRIWKAVGGVKVEGYLYSDDLRIAAQLDGTGGVAARFVYALHRNVPDAMIKGSVTYRILTDHRGSPRLVVNSSTGAVAQRIDYDEFGKVVADTNPGFQPFGFAGGLYDVDTKLVKFGVRDYDAEIGRWTAKDPMRFAGGDTNLYAYAANDPMNKIDPTGLTIAHGGDWFAGTNFYFTVTTFLFQDASVQFDQGNIGTAALDVASGLATGIVGTLAHPAFTMFPAAGVVLSPAQVAERTALHELTVEAMEKGSLTRAEAKTLTEMARELGTKGMIHGPHAPPVDFPHAHIGTLNHLLVCE